MVPAAPLWLPKVALSWLVWHREEAGDTAAEEWSGGAVVGAGAVVSGAALAGDVCAAEPGGEAGDPSEPQAAIESAIAAPTIGSTIRPDPDKLPKLLVRRITRPACPSSALNLRSVAAR
jgi:hypothetical protein